MPVVQCISFDGVKTSYGEVPTVVLGGATVFTIEAKISTLENKNKTSYYSWGTIAGRERSSTWRDDWSFCVNDGKLCFWAQPINHTSTDNYRVLSDAVVNDDKIHAVAVRSNADGSIDLFCDGENVAHQDDVNAKITDATSMLLAYNSNSNSPLAYDLHELRLWNVARPAIFAPITGNESGLQAWYIPTGSEILVDKSPNGYNATLYGSPVYTVIDTLPLNLQCDVLTKIKNPYKTWIYTNSGTADLLSVDGTTLTDLSAEQSKTGSAFYQSEREKCFDIPETEEIWIKFDVYFDGDNRWRAYNGWAGITAWNSSNASPNAIAFFDSNGDQLNYVANAAKKNQLQSVLLHMISGSSEGIIEAWIDGDFIYRYTGDVNHGESFADIYLQSDGAGTFFSSVIISNAQFDEEDLKLEKVTLNLDVKLSLKKSLKAYLDVARRVIGIVAVNLALDVKYNGVLPLSKTLDVLSKLLLTSRQHIDVKILDVIPVTVAIDSSVNFIHDINYSPTNFEEEWEDSEGIIQAKSFDSEEIERNAKSEANTSGLQGLEIHIADQQLTDQVTFSSIIQYQIMQYIGGQYFDYFYQLRIESRQQQGILLTYNCCSNIDELLYTQIAYKVITTETVHDDTQEQASEESEEEKSIEEEEQELLDTGEYHTLFDNAVAVANYFGLSPIVQLGDYAGFYSSYKEQDLWGRTYADAIREVFGWSSRIPHKMINVYIRGDKMFFIRRGSESNVIDISKTAHTVPIINQELVRTFWGTTQWSQTEVKEKFLGTRGLGGDSGDSDDFPADYINNEDDDDDKDNPWSAVGTVTTSNSAGTSVTEYDYTSKGVLKGTTTTFTSNSDESQNSRTVVRNAYNDDGLLEAVQTTVTHPAAPEEDTITEVKYGYMTIGDGQTFLASEVTAEYQRNEQGFFELVDTKATAKSPTGRGQGTSYDSKGKGTASGNVGDDRVTPYQLRTALNTTNALSAQVLKKTTTTKINGFTDIDPSFPLLLLADRATVTNEIVWLNRKIKETASVSVYDFGHIIDFNDRIVLDGKEYFVVSNTVRTAPRLYNEQNLSLVRWFQ